MEQPDATTAAALPDLYQQLTEQNLKLQMQVEELTAKVKWYEEQLGLSRHKQFGSSSERTHPDQVQLDLFNEAEREADPKREEPTM